MKLFYYFHKSIFTILSTVMKDNYFNKLDELIDKEFAHCKKPEFPWNCNLSEYFLLVLDMQNYFLDQSSHAFVPTGLEIINNVNKLIDFARANSIPIAFTRHSNNSDSANMMAFGGMII